MMNNLNDPIEILLVEDDPAHARLTIEAFKEGKILNRLSIVEDGEDALAYLRQEGRYTTAARPDLVLLDLNLPKKDGRELLAELKADQKLRRIPVVILTVSKSEEDVLKAYELHANCYITKPIGLEEFMNVVKSVEDFWLSIVKLPPR